jgi:hypothetical protein
MSVAAGSGNENIGDVYNAEHERTYRSGRRHILSVRRQGEL